MTAKEINNQHNEKRKENQEKTKRVWGEDEIKKRIKEEKPC